MALPVNRPFHEKTVYARTTSIGATPVAGNTVATKKGVVHRAFAYSEGASTGTITVNISINGGASIGSFAFTGGADTSGSGELTPSTAAVNEGDRITFTPSGGGGASIPGHFYAIIRG